jgi:uncharacterized protein YndB with AHSA1/START domain
VDTTANDADVVEREIRIAARPEIIFPFFTDPQQMVRWKGIEATLDPRPGGIYRVVINGRAIASGRYLEVEPPRRIVFTWGWEGDGHSLPPGSSTVEVTLEPDGDGTLLRLVHRNLSPEMRELHRHGWDHYLARLVVATGGGDPGPDPMAANMSISN